MTSSAQAQAPDGSAAWLEDLKAYTQLKPVTSLYHGDHLRGLMDYVTSESQAVQEHGFATLCDFRADPNLRLRNLNDPSELHDTARSSTLTGDVACLLILRGKPTPQWILALGETLGIPWSFFQRHLAMKSNDLEPNLYANPLLPSSCVNIWQVPLFTIVKMKRHDIGSATPSDTERAREAHALKLKGYLDSTQSKAGMSRSNIGQSRLRNSALHDRSTISVEQSATVYVRAWQQGWLGIVWSDAADDLHNIVRRSWFGSKSPEHASFPVRIVSTNIDPPSSIGDIVARQRRRGETPDERASQQNISWLASNYDLGVDPSIAAANPYYALNPVLRLVIVTNAQLINMMSDTIETSLALGSEESLLAEDLQLTQRIVHHIQQEFASCKGLFPGTNLALPGLQIDKLDEVQIADATHLAEQLKRDFDYIEQRAEALSTYCRDALNSTRSRLAMHEAKKANVQADRVAQLTKLGILFVPLTFTTSFFGMNFRELGNGPLSIWIAFVVSAPILAISALFVMPEVRKELQHSLHKLRKSRKSNLEDGHELQPVTQNGYI